MKIIQSRNPEFWFRFLTEIDRKRNESEDSYLARVKDCLLSFHDKYVGRAFLDDSQLIRIYGDFPPSNLTGKSSEFMEYKYFRLKRTYSGLPGEYRFEGSVRLFVEPNSECSVFTGRTGIVSFVGNIEDHKLGQRREDLAFIRKLWKDFSYRPRK
ncbi:hypothetical protein KA107_02350 [Candidatus Pacearchaeota archaeon]|nr:hypothetical protein [Candidatus Pacearchaeota archaeon]